LLFFSLKNIDGFVAALFWTQCQSSFRPKNPGFPNTMVRTLSVLGIFGIEWKGQISKRRKTYPFMCFSWKTIVGFVAALFWTQCQVAFWPKNLDFPNTMVSDFEFFYGYLSVMERKIPKIE
jgi:hypothetical protein